MPWGKKAGAVRAYEYGCLPPTTGEAQAIEIMHARHRLWNSLVELDRDFAADYAALLEPYLALDHLEWKDRFKAAWQSDAFKTQQKDLEWAMYQAGRLDGKVHLGQNWLQYEDVLANWKAARQRSWHPTKAQREAQDGPSVLQFHRWDGTGKISVRWQNGVALLAIFDSDTRLHIDPVDPRAWSSETRSERRHLARTAVRIRMDGEGQRRSPVWLELPMVMHRPLPDDALIRTAAILRERVAGQYRWKLVVVAESVIHQPKTPIGTGTIAVHIGWRKVPAGLRVATCADDSGHTEQWVLPDAFVNGMKQVNNLQSIRDHNLNEWRDTFGDWLVVTSTVIPEWVQFGTSRMKHWKPEKMARFVREWRARRFPDDEVLFSIGLSWLARETHLYEYQENLRDQLLRARREQYRLWAVGLTRKYAEVVLSDIGLARLAKPAKRTVATQGARHQRQLVAPSCLLGALRYACARDGVQVVDVPSPYISTVCNLCGAIRLYDKVSELTHTCEWCGKTWDQDANAAVNMLSQTMGDLAQEGGFRRPEVASSSTGEPEPALSR